MGNLVVENTSKAVKVLKAANQKPLRLFPGFNYLPDDVDYGAYFEDNAAAQGIAKECLRKCTKELSSEEKQLAQNAKEKNEAMNKAYKVIKKNKVDLDKKDATIAKQTEMMEKMQKQLDEQAVLLKDLVAKSKGKDKK